MPINIFASGANRSARPHVFASGANRVVRQVWIFSGGANRRAFAAFSISVDPTVYSISLNTTTGIQSWLRTFTVTATGVGPFTYSWAFASGGAGISLSNTTSAACTGSGSGNGNTTHSGTLRCTVTDTALSETLFVDVPITIQYSNNL